jgi:uncharacterized protein YceK
MKIAETLILILQVVILGLIIAGFTSGCSSVKPYKASGTVEYGDFPDPSTPNV